MRHALALTAAATLVLAAHGVVAQTKTPPVSHGHLPHHHPAPAGAASAPATPGLPGQGAFGAIAEVVRILDADPGTDWSRVDLERLRQHLIDMDEVVLRAQVTPTAVPGGVRMDITGAPRTERAIRAMVVPHAAELAAMSDLAATTEVIAGGVRLTVTARTADDRAVARLRGLGFAGLLALGAHHGPHHLAMARGAAMGAHTH
jgi:hypothetical protein